MIDKKLMPERVELPDLTEAEQQQIEEHKEYAAWRSRTQVGFLKALLWRNPRPFIGVRKPQRKPTKHQRRIANARARSATLKARREDA
jgi:hypothetical protein